MKIANFWLNRILAVLLSTVLCQIPAKASSFHSQGSNPGDFLYSLSLDLSSSSDTEEESLENTSPISNWDDCCIVSAQALMCQGGGEPEPLASPKEDDEESDDDDDDDDDDGHSSMLSNVSLRRSRVAAGGGSSGIVDRGGGEGARESYTATASVSHGSYHASSTILALRGGGSDTGGAGVGILTTVLQSEAARSLMVAALVTLVFELVIGHVLEFLKIVKQTLVEDKSYLQVIKDITASKGIAGLWDGFCPWGVVQAIFKGAVFGLAYSSALSVLKPLADKGIIPLQLALTLAGGIGGGFQGYVLSPTLLLKTRVMTNPVFREKMSMLRTTWLSLCIGSDIVKTEGLGTLMKGSNTFAFKRVADWSSRYFFADMFELLFTKLEKGQPLTVMEKSVASLLGGVFSTCVTLPLDVLVAKTQENKKAGVKVSAWALFRDELREKGVSGLRKAYMQGFEARLAHVCLTTLVIKTGTPIAYNLLFPKKP